MKGYQSKPINRYFIIVIVFLTLIILNISIINATESSEDAHKNNDSYLSILTISSKNKVSEFIDLYSSIISNSDLNYKTIDIDGNVNRLIELSNDSVVVKLPNEKIAIKYSNKTTSILPKGSFVFEEDNEFLISISTQDMIIKVKDVIDLPIYNITKSASYEQSIDNLNEYQVQIVLNEFNNPNLYDNVDSFSVDWGDGSSSEFSKSDQKINHVYKKSGKYYLTINVSDEFGFTHSIRKDFYVNYEGNLVHSYLWIKENKEPFAVTTTSISLLSIGLFAITETGKYKLLALLTLLIPLYTRIQKEDVLDQFVRGQIYGYIKTNPGVHYNQIRRGIDVKNGTLSYHLSVLEKTELIKSRREGLRYRVFYPTGMKFPKEQRFRLTDLQIKIIEIIKENKGVNQKEIALKLRKKPQTINYNIKVLNQADIIKIVKKGRKTFCYPKEKVEIYDKHAQ